MLIDLVYDIKVCLEQESDKDIDWKSADV